MNSRIDIGESIEGMEELSSVLVGIGMANPVMKRFAGKDFYTDLCKQIGQFLDVLYLISKLSIGSRGSSHCMTCFAFITEPGSLILYRLRMC